VILNFKVILNFSHLSPFFSKQVHGVAFSGDGKVIASCSGYHGTTGTDADSDNSVRLWDAATGLQIRILEGHTYVLNYNISTFSLA
jgi:WD40 repeat protein